MSAWPDRLRFAEIAWIADAQLQSTIRDQAREMFAELAALRASRDIAQADSDRLAARLAVVQEVHYPVTQPSDIQRTTEALAAHAVAVGARGCSSEQGEPQP